MQITRDDVIRFINKASDEMNENKDYLIELDANSGDGDLGLTMSKGFAAAKEKANASEETDLGKLLFAAGSAIASPVP
jgi:dihydroxyacetone kinase-like protein